jgi:hypothetical protein
MAGERIGDWDSTTLTKFISDILQNNPPSFFANQTVDNLAVQVKAMIADQIQFARTRTTVGAAGSASALPANPAGYIEILDYTGQPKLIPYYNTP